MFQTLDILIGPYSLVRVEWYRRATFLGKRRAGHQPCPEERREDAVGDRGRTWHAYKGDPMNVHLCPLLDGGIATVVEGMPGHTMGRAAW